MIGFKIVMALLDETSHTPRPLGSFLNIMLLIYSSNLLEEFLDKKMEDKKD